MFFFSSPLLPRTFPASPIFHSFFWKSRISFKASLAPLGIIKYVFLVNRRHWNTVFIGLMLLSQEISTAWAGDWERERETKVCGAYSELEWLAMSLCQADDQTWSYSKVCQQRDLWWRMHQLNELIPFSCINDDINITLNWSKQLISTTFRRHHSESTFLYLTPEDWAIVRAGYVWCMIQLREDVFREEIESGISQLGHTPVNWPQYWNIWQQIFIIESLHIAISLIYLLHLT